MTGIELITQEREEQINKHGWSLKNDTDYLHNELIKAALFAINPEQFEWPFYWHEDFRNKIINKPNAIERLKIAGALIAAEIDRIQLKGEIKDDGLTIYNR
jgi:hypothetical protein